jgi:hypothetical protein
VGLVHKFLHIQHLPFLVELKFLFYVDHRLPQVLALRLELVSLFNQNGIILSQQLVFLSQAENALLHLTNLGPVLFHLTSKILNFLLSCSFVFFELQKNLFFLDS